MIETCCLTGLKPLDLPFGFDEESTEAASLAEVLKQEIESTIASGCSRFITGMEWGAEIIAAEIVLKLREQHSALHLVCVVPFEEQAAKWNEEYRNRYFEILIAANEMKLISTRFEQDCFARRDAFLLHNATRILGVIDEEKGAPGTLIERAIQRGMDATLVDARTRNVRRIAGHRKIKLIK